MDTDKTYHENTEEQRHGIKSDRIYRIKTGLKILLIPSKK